MTEIQTGGAIDVSERPAGAAAFIDKALGQMLTRELVSAGEVSDFLLDMRNLLANGIDPSPKPADS